jgi:hypothetical protein
MENTLVRAFVLMLSLAGFGASTFSARHTSKTTVAKPADNIVGGPACLPNDPTHCGLD